MKYQLSLSVIDMARLSCLQPLTKFLTYFVNQEKNKTINKRELMAVNEDIVIKLYQCQFGNYVIS